MVVLAEKRHRDDLWVVSHILGQGTFPARAPSASKSAIHSSMVFVRMIARMRSPTSCTTASA